MTKTEKIEAQASKLYKEIAPHIEEVRQIGAKLLPLQAEYIDIVTGQIAPKAQQFIDYVAVGQLDVRNSINDLRAAAQKLTSQLLEKKIVPTLVVKQPGGSVVFFATAKK